MAWVKTLPDGDKAATSLDDDIRTNNDAIEAAISAEHTFASGGNQDGRHVFMRDTQANIAAVSTFVDGAAAIATDVCTDPVWTYFDGSDWFHALEPYLANANDWAAGQYCTQKALTSGANVSSDWSDSNIFTLTLAHNAEIDNPTNQPAAKSGVWYYIVTQGAGTAYTLTFGTHFANPEPTVDPVLGSVSVFQCTLLSSSTIGGIEIERISGLGREDFPGLVQFASDAEAMAGLESTKAVTPSNLAAHFDATASAGFVEIIGTGKLLQWVSGTVDAVGYLVFATPFNDTLYTMATRQNGIYVTAFNIIDASTVEVAIAGGGAQYCAIIAIGDKVP
jgi:hypothetical protein